MATSDGELGDHLANGDHDGVDDGAHDHIAEEETEGTTIAERVGGTEEET
jgi:hypothetical protein